MPRSNIESTRSLLDQLMGKDRNLTTAARAAQRASIHYTSDRICPHFLVAFCPHTLFQHTKSDMGACSRVHDERTRDEFRREEDAGIRLWYEEKFYRYCQGLIDDIERKMRRQQADSAAAATASTTTAAPSPTAAAAAAGSTGATASATSVLSHLLSTDAAYLALSSELSTLTTSIQTIQAQIDSLTAAGQHTVVDRIQAMKTKLQSNATEKTNQMNDRRLQLEQLAHDSPNTTTVLPAVTITSGPQSKRMLLCEVCGTALVAGDDEARMAAHRAGKQHQGYETIREWMKEFEEKRARLRDGKGLSEVEVVEVEKKIADKARAAAAAEEKSNSNGSGDHGHERTAGGGEGWNGRSRGGGGGGGGGWGGGSRYEDRGGGGGGSSRGGIGYDRRGGGGGGWGGDRAREQQQYDGRRGGGSGYDRGDSGAGGAGGGGGRYDGGGSSRYDDRRVDERSSHRRRSRSRSPVKSRSRSRSRERHRRR